MGFGGQPLFIGNAGERLNIQGFTDAATFTYIDTIFFVPG
jgi:hypothetical protein